MQRQPSSSTAINDYQRSSAAISGHQQPSTTISAHQQTSVAISGNQWSSAASGHPRQWQSVVISGHQRQSVAIRGSEHITSMPPRGALSRKACTLPDATASTGVPISASRSIACAVLAWAK